MSNAFIGEIRIFGFPFAPRDWMFCDGQLLSISQYTALFSIIGTYYGGNGQTTFELPNFQGNTAIGQGTGPGLSTYNLGEVSGVANVTVTQGQMPLHNHALNVLEGAGSVAGQEQRIPGPNYYLGFSGPDKLFSDAVPSPTANFASTAIGTAGGSQPHNNMQPLTTLNFCICVYGIFPSRN